MKRYIFHTELEVVRIIKATRAWRKGNHNYSINSTKVIRRRKVDHRKDGGMWSGQVSKKRGL